MLQTDRARPEPLNDCSLCPRLRAFVLEQRRSEPDWHNAPVASFGDERARLLIVGLAPGLRGANRTGRPFTGDYAGELLYGTLLDYGFAQGTYDARPDDGMRLVDTMITNAVRCVPPANKPTPAEIKTCRTFLTRRIEAQTHLRAIVALGRVAHDSVVAALGLKRASTAFAHGARHNTGACAATGGQGIVLFDSYHCSRYNTNTGVLTQAMFREVFASVRNHLDSQA